MIQVGHLTFMYRSIDRPLFSEFDWTIEAGQHWVVIGPSGCGKTTLLFLLAGLRKPLTGTITIDGSQLVGPRSATGLILQNCGLLPWATAWENAAFGLRLRGFRGNHLQQVVNQWLTRLDVAHVAHHYPSELSGGQRQRVAIARTFAVEPDLLLMDEPFSALDAMTREDLQNLTVQIGSQAKVTSIVVTHSIEEAAFLGNHILILPNATVHRPEVVDNPGAWQSSYRFSRAFHDVCDALRKRLAML
jgi:ABC-type nitrate/sulfonate/bicarbonate transport system ATPase subunit